MTYLVVMNYALLLAICEHMGIISSNSALTFFLILSGDVALVVHLYLKDKRRASDEVD